MKSFFFDPQKQLEQELRSHSDIILRGTYLRDSLLPKSAKPMSLIKEAGALDAPMSDAQLKSELPLMGSGGNRTQVFDGVFIKDQRLMSWCKRYSRLDPIEVDGDPDLGDLNITQRRAIALMLAEKVSLVQGPPGTGKTRTLIEAIRLLKVIKDSREDKYLNSLNRRILRFHNPSSSALTPMLLWIILSRALQMEFQLPMAIFPGEACL